VGVEVSADETRTLLDDCVGVVKDSIGGEDAERFASLKKLGREGLVSEPGDVLFIGLINPTTGPTSLASLYNRKTS
jgi:hypothetical protein